MIAGTYNINICQGSTYSLTVTLKDSAGVAIDITTYSFAADIKETYGGTTILSFTCTNTTPTSGIMTMSLTAAQTTTLTKTAYIYDLEYTVGSTKKRVMQGEVTVSQEVTV